MTATPPEPPPGLPFSQACENNKAPILAVLAQAFADRRHVLEIGSGTGQHGVHFAPRLPHLVWQTSDLAENHAGIRAWHALHPAPNLRPPLLLDLQGGDWPPGAFDAVFTSNTTHIVAWPLGRIDIQTPPSLPIAACQARRDEGAGRYQQPKSNDAWQAAMGNPSGQGPGQPPASLLAAGVSRYTARLAPSRRLPRTLATGVFECRFALVQRLFALAGAHLPPGGVLAVYGPFNYGGGFTSDSNRAFDAWLRARDPASGIRHFEDIVALAARHGLALERDHAMPANNRLLVLRRSGGAQAAVE